MKKGLKELSEEVTRLTTALNEKALIKSKTDQALLKLIQKRGLTPGELEHILKSSESPPPKPELVFKDYFEDKLKFGVFSDTHIGSKEFDEPFFKYMIDVFKKEGVSRIYQVGDILEGMSHRAGHIYELSQIGYHSQISKAIDLFKQLPVDTFGIDGNHDEWYQKNMNQGVIVGVELDRCVPQYHHLGQMEANVKLKSNITMRLFHPNDGSAYAISYKMQKLIESFTGGDKPEILLEGHYHKAMYIFNRNIHGLECGTLAGQTKFMRGKKIPAHKGFWIVELEAGKGGIGSFKPTFYAGYR